MKEIPVFDRRDALPTIKESGEWQPPRSTQVPGVHIHLPEDGPTTEWRVAAQAGRLTSNANSGQAANDNEDWPLQKLLRTERNDYCLDLAVKYRNLVDVATRPTSLIGREADNLYMVQNVDADDNLKGVKRINGKKASADMPAKQARSTGEQAKQRAAPVARKWNGDWPLLAAIDARRELAYLRGKLGFVPKILDAFEWAVVDSLTLAEIGERLGAGSKGAKGEARARVFDGFELIDRYWRGSRSLAA